MIGDASAFGRGSGRAALGDAKSLPRRRDGAAFAATHAEIVEITDLETCRDALGDLAARAPESNVFFEPIVLDAAMKEERRIDRIKLVLVWEDAERTVLAGMLPVRIIHGKWGPGTRVGYGWKHDSGIRGTPLIASGRAQLFWAYALDAIRRSSLPRYLILPTIPLDGEAHNGLRAATLTTGRRAQIVGRETHIVMRPDTDGESYLQQAMSARRYKRMAKSRRDLEKLGKLEHRLYTDAGDVMVALRRFIEIEAAGWKGATSGAMVSKPHILRFFLRSVCDFALEGRIRLDSLELDGKPIGMSIVALSGHTAYCWKTTFDERYAKYSPGMLTVMDVTRGIIGDPRVTYADSCTDAGHSLMEHLWSEKSEMVDILINVEPNSGLFGFNAALLAETTRRRTRKRAKKIYLAARAKLKAWFKRR